MSAGWGAGKSGHFTITLLAYEIVLLLLLLLLLFINLINFLLAKWKVNNGSLPNPPPHPFCCYALPLLDLFPWIINKIYRKKLKSVKQNLKKRKCSPWYTYDCTRVLFVICTCGRTLLLFYMKNALVFSQSEAHKFFSGKLLLQKRITELRRNQYKQKVPFVEFSSHVGNLFLHSLHFSLMTVVSWWNSLFQLKIVLSISRELQSARTFVIWLIR